MFRHGGWRPFLVRTMKWHEDAKEEEEQNVPEEVEDTNSGWLSSFFGVTASAPASKRSILQDELTIRRGEQSTSLTIVGSVRIRRASSSDRLGYAERASSSDRSEHADPTTRIHRAS
eukprot:7809623-Pyramimonas_sp.AAC.1